MKIYQNKKLLIIAYIFALLVGMIGGQESALADAGNGDASGFFPGVPDGWVGPEDLVWGVNLVNSFPGPPKYRAPAAAAPALDIADVNGQGLVGDGWVDAGDINFLAEVMSTWSDTEYYREVPALPPSYTSPTAGAEIGITVNGQPWDEVSPVSPNDVIGVAWVGTDSASWGGGFCNFTLNVSKGQYLNNLAKSPSLGTWWFDRFTVIPDGQGGINVGNVGGDAFFWSCFGGCYGGWFCCVSPLEIFSFSFRVPDVNGPAYTIDIRPTQGSWRLIMYDQLPYTQLQVCINPPQYDLNKDCIVDFHDFALLASEWLFCGLE